MLHDKQQSPEQNQGQGGSKASHPLDRYTVQPQNNDSKDSPFYKPAAPTISLPKGGGALKGIDEKFSVNAINGTAGLELPLPLTPGRGGFTPALSVSYNSGSGNGPFGLGWNLSLPVIQRRTDKQWPRYQDDIESDVFLLAGAEDLVPQLDEQGDPVERITPNATYFIKNYIPRIEGLFARIEYIQKQGVAGGWWRVTTRDNVTTYYGLTAEGRLAMPETPGKIFQWLPQLSTDHKGNVQIYRYTAENLLNVPAAVYEKNRLNGKALFANTYLKRVQYCNAAAWYITEQEAYEPALPFDVVFLMEAVLDYGDHSTPHKPAPDQDWAARCDAFSAFHAGFEIRTYRKCQRVLMFHYFDELSEGAAHLVRSLELNYKYDGHTEPVEADMLLSATQRGYIYDAAHDAWYDKALPPMTFDYEPLHWDNEVHNVSRADFTHAPQGLTGPYQWIDFEGEGISGILTEQGNGWFYKNNLGDGHFAPAKSIAEKPSFNGLGNGLQWQDLGADGNRQVVTQEPVSGYWELRDKEKPAQRKPGWQPFRAFEKKLHINWDSPFTKMLDLDGDGRPDILVTEDRAWTWYHNEGKKGYGPGGNAPVFTDEERGPVLLLRDPVQSIFLADMNGDGLTDLVRIRNSEICYWPNMGYGQFGAKVSMGNVPLFDTPDGYNPLYLTLADISGTGAADLVYLGRNNCTAWINCCGNAWSEARVISPLPATDPYSKIAVLDFLGNGTGCIVWSSPLPQHAHAPLRYIDLMAGKKPYLLRSYENGMGKTVSVNYKSSSQYYLEDKRNGYPWATLLPFPVHCIESVTTTDEVSETSYTQQYRYRHGYYDHEEREFRGFGYVETLDIDKAVLSGEGDAELSLDQPPVLTKTWNHIGAWMREGILTEAYKQEYFLFPEWDEQTLIADIPHGLKAQELREAYRALKGLPLRQEIYALDGSPSEQIPYTVTATAYAVQLIQPLGENRYASFLSHKRQSVVYSSERQAQDPRVAQELVLETDQYGNVLKSAQVAYPRKVTDTTLPLKVQEEQAKMHITYSESHFTNDVSDQVLHYRLRVPYESQGYELLGYTAPAGLWTREQLLTFAYSAQAIGFAAVPSGNAEKRLLAHSYSLFEDNTATGTALAKGILPSLALPYESYTLAFTDTILDRCYEDLFNDPFDPASPTLPAALTDLGYSYDGYSSYWLPSGTVSYTDAADHFYIPFTYRDPWGNETSVTYWNDSCILPRKVTDALGNTAEVTGYDWRLLQPVMMKDANDNISAIRYDALGMPVAMALMGKGSEGDNLLTPDIFDFADEQAQELFFAGDAENQAAQLLGNATWRCVYRLDQLPLAVGMIARTRHVAELGPGVVNETLVRLSYTDAFGRVLMHKAQCEANTDNGNKHWIGSGRTVYNNKGKAVLQYEPYFSSSSECDTAEQAANEGVSPQIYYDALGRAYRTVMPDATFTKTGWTAWQQTVWDSNDTAMDSLWYLARRNGNMGGQELDAAVKVEAHYNTPTVLHTDSLARAFYTIQQDSQTHEIHSYVSLDIQGNRLSITDGNGLVPLQYRYSMLQQPCYQQSVDSGTNRTLTDVAGQPCMSWDAELRLFTIGYDALRRPISKTCIESGTHILQEITEYGESYTAGDPKALNLLGQVHTRYDGSGKQWLPEGYDFKGMPVKTSLSLLQDKTATDSDWNALPALESQVYTTETKVDALGRPLQSTDPGGNISTYAYDKGGALKKVTLNGTDYVKDIHYDAQGRRSAIWYGNGTKTAYAYDPLTYRLRRLHTVNVDDTSSHYNEMLQDLNYAYDPVGNITSIWDFAQQTLFFNNTIIDPSQEFTYDALYRLIQATGREQKGSSSFGPQDNYNDAAWQTTHKGDGDNTQRYKQQYTYDAAGNILELQHIADSNSYTRTYDIDTVSNRMSGTTVGADSYSYSYDDRGNMMKLPHLDFMNWNALSELHRIVRGTGTTWYQYSGGQRTRKYTDKGSIKEERVYLGGYEIYRKFDSSSLKIVERTTVHVSDDTGRIALLETRTFGNAADDNNTDAVLQRYIYSNHLQSASLELNESAEIISYEEYHPYGTTAYQANNPSIKAVAKRYRYTGKERDEESGLYYHGARYYIPWLGRWSASDPLESKYAGFSPYNYSFNNPVMWNDPSGMGPTDPSQTVSTVDNVAAPPRAQVDNAIPYLSPTGGNVYLPPTAEVTGKYDERPLLSNGIFLGNAMLGSVESFKYQNENYLARFDKNGEFFGYYSTTNSAHFMDAYFNTLPALPEDPTAKLMRRIEGGAKFLIGAIGAMGSAAFAGISSPTGIGFVVGSAGVVYFSDQAVAGFGQMISGEHTPTYYQKGLSAMGLSSNAVAAIDFGTGAFLGMGTSMPVASPSSTSSASRMMTIAESSEHSLVVNTVENGILPGSRGAYLGSRRLGESTMRTLSEQHDVEFAQFYFAGQGKNGGGGYYMLYSGSKTGINVQIERNMFWINHTHPGGNINPSIWDVDLLKGLQQFGSAQRSSVILPFGKPASTFNIFSKTL